MADKEKNKETAKERKIKKLEAELKLKEEAELEIKKLDDLLRHLNNVREGSVILGKRLIEQGEFEFGRMVIANSLNHDYSKFLDFEWKYLHSDVLDDNPEMFKIAIKQHHMGNNHHPEMHYGVSNMGRMQLALMVIDWRARSVEMGTDLIEFFKNEAMAKYDIKVNSKPYKEIKFFIELILDKKFKKVK